MKGFIKYTLVSAVSVSMLAVITTSNADSKTPLHKYRQLNQRGISIMAVDTPGTDTITNADLHYPIHPPGYDEPIYQNNHPLELNDPANVQTTKR